MSPREPHPQPLSGAERGGSHHVLPSPRRRGAGGEVYPVCQAWAFHLGFGLGNGRKVDMMAILRVLSSAGDTSYEWDVAGVERGDAEALAAVREAERIFDERRARGGTAFRVWPGQTAERLDRFDPQAEQIVFVPRVAGG